LSVEVSVAASRLTGQSASGDRYLVTPLHQGVLVAVVDGLGHGEAAAVAADLAIRTLDRHDEASLIPRVKECHERLRGTRGAVMSLAAFSTRDSTMTWLGVGNVEGRLLRSPGKRRGDCESLLLRAGVVGAQLPPLRAAVIPVASGDIVILATDGIASGFARAVVVTDQTQRIADRILAEHSKATDDALVLVSRYLGTDGVRHEDRIASPRIAARDGT
jgi:phosphoserine phosphatase RsbX